VDYLTGTGLGRLVALYKRLRAAGGRLSLRNVGGVLHDALALTRLTDLLDVRAKAEGGGPRLRVAGPVRLPTARRPRPDKAATHWPLDGRSSPAGPGS
jgi:hypothetical protein